MRIKGRRRVSTGHLCKQHQDNTQLYTPKKFDSSKLRVDGNSNMSYSVPTSGDAGANLYDSDSYLILVENCCSACITNNINGFEGKPVKVNARVKGVGGAIKLSHKGTIKWSFEDNEGQSHTFRINDSYFAPNAPCWLLSPQHWSQNSNDNSARSKGTWSASYDNKVELHWDNNTYHQMITLDKNINVVAICSTPGDMHNRVFHALHEVTVDYTMPVCFNTQVVMDDGESYSDSPSKPQFDEASVEEIIHQHSLTTIQLT
jgi:hypothetical protein